MRKIPPTSNGVAADPIAPATVVSPVGGSVVSGTTTAATATPATISSSYLRLMQNAQTRQNIQNISRLLNTGLSDQTLDICVKLCEAGVHPLSLAEVVRQLRTAEQQQQPDPRS